MNVNSNFFEAKHSPWAMPALRLAGVCLLYGGSVLGTAMAQDLPNAPDTRPAVGTTPEAQKPASSPWSVGVGSFTQWQPYTGLSAQTKVLPLLGYDNGIVKWQGPVLDVRLPVSAPSSAYALSARAYYSGDGYAADDAPVFEGMAKRQSSVWLGAAGTARFSWGQLSGHWLKDAMAHSQGQQARLAISTLVPTGPVRWLPRLAWVWQDQKSVDYYYGVKPSEARASRPAYEGRATSSLEVGLTGIYALDAHQSLYLDVSAQQLGSAIQNSPLVDRKQLTKLRMGYAYRF